MIFRFQQGTKKDLQAIYVLQESPQIQHRIDFTMMHYTSQQEVLINDSMKHDTLPQLSLYDILGGDDVVSAIIDAVYERMNKDRTLSWCYFLRQNTPASKNFQLEFFSLILIHGLPSDTLKMETALITRLEHLFTLGLNEQTFDVMIGHLVLTLESFQVTRLVVIEVVRTFMPFRKVFEAGSFHALSRQNMARRSVYMVPFRK
jgi:truncated hemoglobin YjbI